MPTMSGQGILRVLGCSPSGIVAHQARRFADDLDAPYDRSLDHVIGEKVFKGT